MSNLDRGVEILKRGGVVIFPTDTVWGIGVAADNQKAKEKLYKIKKREKNKPTAVLVADLKQAEGFGVFDKQAKEVAQKYWPGALTIVVSGKDGGTVGLRASDHPVAQELCRRIGGILAGSANFAGKEAPQRREDLDEDLVKLVDMVVEGECDGQEASTVVDTTVEPWRVVRQGPVKLQ